MAYGFQVINSENKVVLDAASILPASEGSDIFSTDAQGVFSTSKKRGIYLVPLTNDQMMTPQRSAPGLNTFRLRSGAGSPPPALANTDITTKRIVSFNEVSPPSGYGMAVFTSEGEAVFHTNAPLLSVLSVQRHILSASQNELNVDIPSAATHFIIQSGWRQFFPIPQTQNTLVISVGIKRLTAATAVLMPDQWGSLEISTSNTSAVQDCPVTFLAARIIEPIG
ncbi:hypothetical protein [Roseinatronobacter sp. NSM]|uniref:hypothetical protein n=1 Tax=Roseinatronobacter sp. NSM TaxID=3457785 RepID=UPI004036A439